MRDYIAIRWLFITEDIKSIFRKIFFRKQTLISNTIKELNKDNSKHAISYLENDMLKIETSPIPRHTITTHANPKFQSFINKGNEMYTDNTFSGWLKEEGVQYN